MRVCADAYACIFIAIFTVASALYLHVSNRAYIALTKYPTIVATILCVSLSVCCAFCRLLHRMMVVPGRILHLIKIDVAEEFKGRMSWLMSMLGEGVQRSFLMAGLRCCCCTRLRKIYAPRWGNPSNLLRLQVSVDMVGATICVLAQKL